MPRRATPLLILVLALIVPASAAAAPAYEPNDGIHQAFGPLETGKNYDGVLSASEDVDWYVFYASGPGTAEVSIAKRSGVPAAPGCHSVYAELLDADGNPLNEVGTEDAAKSVVYNTPGAGAYYVRVTGYGGWSLCMFGSYRLKVTGPLTAGPRPGPAEITPNSNQDLATALGPLLGGKLYGGSIDTRSEEDWFFFYTAGPGAFDIAVTDINDWRCCGSIVAELLDASGKELSRVSPDRDKIGHLRYTAPNAAKFVLKIRSSNESPPDSYQFRIDPADLITTNPPPGPTQACVNSRATRNKAQRNLKAAQRNLNAAKRKVRNARKAKVKRRLRKAQRKQANVVKKRQAALRKANQRVKNLC